MNRFILALVALSPVPAAAQDAAPQPPVTYDEALACTFLATSMIMRDDRSRTQKSASGALVTRYMDYAVRLSGKTQAEVVDDMADLSGGILEEIKASADPGAETEARYGVCETDAARL